jgi:hypothetical protein
MPMRNVRNFLYSRTSLTRIFKGNEYLFELKKFRVTETENKFLLEMSIITDLYVHIYFIYQCI